MSTLCQHIFFGYKMSEKRTEHLHIRLTPEFKQLLEELAERERSSKSQLVTRLLLREAERRGLINGDLAA